MATEQQDRNPYIGSGEDGARRSAQIDREEADGLAWGDDRRDALEQSADRWEEQAHRLVLARVGARPDLTELRMSVGNERWLAAIALLDLSPQLANDAARFTLWSSTGGRYTYTGDGENRVSTFHPNALLNWDAWVADVERGGRGWSSTENRLFDLAAALVIDGRQVSLPGVLDALGSWERPALDVLVQWASGGNNREQAGRYRIADNT